MHYHIYLVCLLARYTYTQPTGESSDKEENKNEENSSSDIRGTIVPSEKHEWENLLCGGKNWDCPIMKQKKVESNDKVKEVCFPRLNKRDWYRMELKNVELREKSMSEKLAFIAKEFSLLYYIPFYERVKEELVTPNKWLQALLMRGLTDTKGIDRVELFVLIPKFKNGEPDHPPCKLSRRNENTGVPKLEILLQRLDCDAVKKVITVTDQAPRCFRAFQTESELEQYIQERQNAQKDADDTDIEDRGKGDDATVAKKRFKAITGTELKNWIWYETNDDCECDDLEEKFE